MNNIQSIKPNIKENYLELKELIIKMNQSLIQGISQASLKALTQELIKTRIEILNLKTKGKTQETEELLRLFNDTVKRLTLFKQTEVRELPSLTAMTRESLNQILNNNLIFQQSSEEKKKFLKSLIPKNLGHLIGDSYILGMVDERGAPLEANSFSGSIEFLLTALEYLPTCYPDKFKEKESEIGNCIKILKESFKFFKQLESIIEIEDSQRDLKNLLFKQFIDSIKTSIVGLQPGETLLLPWGWSDPSKIGHAMLIEVTKIQEDLHLNVYNTGSGTKYHEINNRNGKIIINTLRHYIISESKREDFINIL